VATRPSAFPIKRHIFYTAAIYASGIQKGDEWDNLKPVFSIVLYKNKGDAKLFERAALTGDLIKTSDDSKQLSMIAINTAKWKDAESKDLRAYLATFHHGIMTEENKSDFAGVDVESTVFTGIQRAVRMACAHTKKQDYEEKGDDSMAALYATYLTDEERIAAEVRGEAKGRSATREIYRLIMKNVPMSEIADRYQLSTEEVKELENDISLLRD